MLIDDRTVLELEPLRDAFVARDLEERRLNKNTEDAWISYIAEQVERHERATTVAKDWIKQVSSSRKRDFLNFVPSFDETCKLFVLFFWLIKTNEVSKAMKLIRERRRTWNLEPRSFYDLSYADHLEPEIAFSVPAVPPRLSTRTADVSATIKQFKIPVASRRKKVSKPTSSEIIKRQEAAGASLKKQRKKARSTSRGSRPAADKNEGSRIAPDQGVNGALGVTLEQQATGTDKMYRVAQSSFKTRESTQMHVDSPPARPENHQHSTNTRGDGVPSSRPTQLPKRKRATNTRTKLKPSVLPKKVTNRAAGSASALVPEPPSEYILEDDERIHITIASKYPYVEPEKEPEAAVFPKQPLSVKPPVWAESRQEVCESLDYFRSYHSGVYHVKNIVKGYLLGGHSSSRDAFHHGGRLIISHGGGKAEALYSSNRCLEVREAGDQLEDDRSVRALLNNYKRRQPLVLLVDDTYRLFPFDLTASGYTYVVLGHYWITHAWAELQKVNENHGVVRYKFVFQWCEGQEGQDNPWWSQDAEHVSATPQAEASQNQGQSNVLSYVDQGDSQSLQPRMITHHCFQCRMSSPVIYEGIHMCLQPRCPLFFRVNAGGFAAGGSLLLSLSYSAELLRLRPANHLAVSVASVPNSPNKTNTTSYPISKGMHCLECGRLSSRFKWEHFQCSNSKCDLIYKVPHFKFNHKEFWLQEQTLRHFQHYRIAEDAGIVPFRTLATNGEARLSVQTFRLPHDSGHIHVISSHASINDEAHRLFGAYQEQANEGIIQFRRWPLRTVYDKLVCGLISPVPPLGRGQLLSNYFSQNTGVPYQYIGGAERTTPLAEGAKPVIGALELIQDRIARALGKHIDFNEILSAAYMEKQKMAFHSDNERGLGPVIASLSLGSMAEMHFRLHSKYIAPEEPRKIAMTLLLRHGDVLVMEGSRVQEYYEHAVVPKNFRIAATARSISPENYTPYSDLKLDIPR